jgi:hypothetical protein
MDDDVVIEVVSIDGDPAKLGTVDLHRSGLLLIDLYQIILRPGAAEMNPIPMRAFCAVAFSRKLPSH